MSLIRKISAAAGVAIMFATGAPAFAQEAPAAAAAPAPLTTLQALAQGRALLKQAIVARRKTEKSSSYGRPSWAHVTLAVWEKGADRVSLVDIDKSGTTVHVRTPGDWPISVSYDSRLYSQYSLPPARNATVVGVIYPVAVKVSKVTYALHDTLYVPFQDAFYRPEILAAGSDYLSNLIQQAFDELRASGVHSSAYPDKLVADVIDPYLIKSIVVIEHTGQQALLRQDAPEHALGVFLAKLGINGEDAFDVALSSAGASGLVQFIPSTYALYVKNRPQYALIPDFATGMSDHKNAIKAEVAYLDDALAALPAPVRATYESDRMQAAGFLAAAYNGGTTRVTRAMATYGDGWSDSHSAQLAQLNALAASLRWKTSAKAKAQRADAIVKIATIRRSSLRDETVYYVAKLERTYGMFTAGMFSTPNAPSGGLPLVAQATAPAASTPAVPPQASAGAETFCFGDGSCASS